MNFLVITGSLFNQSGGPFHSVLSLVKAMLVNKHKVTVIGSKDEANQPFCSYAYKDLSKQYSLLKVFALRKFGPYNLHFTPSIKKVANSCEPYDVVMIQGIWQWNCWWGFWYAYRKNIKSIISVRGEIVDSKSLSEFKKRLFLPWIKFMLNRVSFIHVLNEREKEALIKLGIKSKITIIPNGIFIPKNSSVNQSNNILYLGRVHPIKNLISLVEGWKTAKTGDWQLIIAGGGDKQYENQVKAAAGDSRSIKFLGPVYGDQKKEAFECAKWFILASRNEGMPMAVLEAMSYGIPVIVSPPCNLNEVVSDGAGLSTGISPAEIAKSIEKAINIPEKKRVFMSDQCLKIVKEKFNWPAIVTQFENTINNLN